MSQLKLYNRDGNVSGEMNAPEVLSAQWNAALVHQVFKAIAANMRKPVAHTKNRGEVRGGGIKPWKQKGTGRARHGSIRSPLWRHGGVAFGPRNERDFSQKTNRKMLKEALASALAKKFSLNELRVVSDLEAKDSKTKYIAQAVRNLVGDKSTLLVLASGNQSALRAAANLNRVDPITVANLNAFNILSHKFIVMEQAALQELTAQTN
jgi:large subunit ribosomal protein L4